MINFNKDNEAKILKENIFKITLKSYDSTIEDSGYGIIDFYMIFRDRSLLKAMKTPFTAVWDKWFIKNIEMLDEDEKFDIDDNIIYEYLEEILNDLKYMDQEIRNKIENEKLNRKFRVMYKTVSANGVSGPIVTEIVEGKNKTDAENQIYFKVNEESDCICHAYIEKTEEVK